MPLGPNRVLPIAKTRTLAPLTFVAITLYEELQMKKAVTNWGSWINRNPDRAVWLTILLLATTAMIWMAVQGHLAA